MLHTLLHAHLRFLLWQKTLARIYQNRTSEEEENIKNSSILFALPFIFILRSSLTHRRAHTADAAAAKADKALILCMFESTAEQCSPDHCFNFLFVFKVYFIAILRSHQHSSKTEGWVLQSCSVTLNYNWSQNLYNICNRKKQLRKIFIYQY